MLVHKLKLKCFIPSVQPLLKVSTIVLLNQFLVWFLKGKVIYPSCISFWNKRISTVTDYLAIMFHFLCLQPVYLYVENCPLVSFLLLYLLKFFHFYFCTESCFLFPGIWMEVMSCSLEGSVRTYHMYTHSCSTNTLLDV